MHDQPIYKVVINTTRDCNESLILEVWPASHHWSLFNVTPEDNYLGQQTSVSSDYAWIWIENNLTEPNEQCSVRELQKFCF